MARWHGTEQGRLLKALAEKEWLIDGDNLEQQFLDTITEVICGSAYASASMNSSKEQDSQD